MTRDQARAACLTPACVSNNDKFIIVQTDNGEVIEGHHSEPYAQRCMGWLKDHERRCGRNTEYHIQPLD